MLCHGVVAQCCVLSRFLHPSAPVRAKYLNPVKDHTSELVVLLRDSIKVDSLGAAVVPVFFFSHPDLEGVELYAAKRYVQVIQEEAEKFLFNVPAPSMRCDRQGVIVLRNIERVQHPAKG